MAKKILLCILLYAFLFFGGYVFAEETITVTSYYPSPYGVYNELRLYPRTTEPSTCDANNRGAMYYNSTSGSFLVCGSSGWSAPVAGGTTIPCDWTGVRQVPPALNCFWGCWLPLSATVYSTNISCDGTKVTSISQGPAVCYACLGSPCSCFVAGTKIAMADGTMKNIEDIAVGDKVLGNKNSINTVLKLDRPVVGNRSTYLINGNVEVTGEHPFLTVKGWKVPDLDLFYQQKKEHGRYKDIEPLQLEAGDVLLTDKGKEPLLSIKELKVRPEEEIVYDFLVDGDHTYIANGYVVWDSK